MARLIEVQPVSGACFRFALRDRPTLPGSLLRYVDASHSQVTQSAACNGRHQIEQRLARWLLMTHDRVEDDNFRMTQEFMSTMVGVRRPGVGSLVEAMAGAIAAGLRPMARQAHGLFEGRRHTGNDGADGEPYRHAHDPALRSPARGTQP
jgi:hypothetical protein